MGVGSSGAPLESASWVRFVMQTDAGCQGSARWSEVRRARAVLVTGGRARGAGVAAVGCALPGASHHAHTMVRPVTGVYARIDAYGGVTVWARATHTTPTTARHSRHVNL